MIGKLAVLAAILGGFYLALKLYKRERARVERKLSEVARQQAADQKTVELERDPASGKYRPSGDRSDSDEHGG